MKITETIKHHLEANQNMRKRDILLGNFLGGLSWGFGTVVGATVVVAILFYGLKVIGIFDTVNSILDIAPKIQKTLPRETNE